MKQLGQNLLRHTFCVTLSLLLGVTFADHVAADLNINIVAVNATDEDKEKEIKQYLPEELQLEDILDPVGLEVDYDVNKGAYFVHGKVNLAPKETKTLKVRIRDLWKYDVEEVEEIKRQIEVNSNRIKGTRYYQTGQIRRESLLQRLDYIIKQEERYQDNVEKRIDQHRTYSEEFKTIRGNALSVKYWRSKPPDEEEAKTFSYIISLSNAGNDQPKTFEPKSYLPEEVKPEHISELEGFEIHFDPLKGQSYLTRKVELGPEEVKKYRINIIDIWNVSEEEIENLKNRTRKTYKLLENTEYVDSAGYLVASIKDKLSAIEELQEKEKGIKEHISAYRVNNKRFVSAFEDVEALENLLEAVRENLERSRLKNVLSKIKALNSIKEISRSIFSKPQLNTAWKIITGIVIFVGGLTILHFANMGRQTGNIKRREKEEDKEKPSK